MFAKQGVTTFASQITAPTWIISATRASASFVHCTVGENLIREGPSWIILSHRVQTTKKPSPDPQEEKQPDAHDGYLTFSVSCLIVF